MLVDGELKHLLGVELGAKPSDNVDMVAKIVTAFNMFNEDDDLFAILFGERLIFLLILCSCDRFILDMDIMLISNCMNWYGVYP